MVQKDEIEEQNIEEFHKVSYWKKYFADNSTISLNYIDMPDKTKLLLVEATPVNYSDQRPVLLLPGWFSMIIHWQEVTKRLSKETKVYYWESREKSSSIIPNRDVDMDISRMAKDLSVLFNHLTETSDLITLSSSMGGTVLFEYLNMIDEDGLTPCLNIMIGPNPHFDTPALITPILVRLPLFMITLTKKIILWYTRTFRLDPENEPAQAEKYEIVLKNAEPWKLRQSGRECLDFEAWNFLDQINSSIILIGASLDKLHEAQTTKDIAEILPQAEYKDFRSNKATHSKEMAEFVLNYTNHEVEQNIRS